MGKIWASVTEPLTHKKEINELIQDAQRTYDTACSDLEHQKKRTTNSLKKMAEEKTTAWAKEMTDFITVFNTFKRLQIKNELQKTSLKYIGSDVTPEQMMINMQNASFTAKEIAKTGFASIGTGAVVGIASYGGAMMFGTASTGAAISSLYGAAKANALLAWFGGGAKAVGGLGMAGGSVVFAGIVVAPVLGVAALITKAKGDERLAEAKQVNVKAKAAAAELKIMTKGMCGVEHISNNYTEFIILLRENFAPFVDALNKIHERHANDNDGVISIDSLSVSEQKTLHVSWLMAQIFYHVLSTPILTPEGDISKNAESELNASKKELEEMKWDVFRVKMQNSFIGDVSYSLETDKTMLAGFVVMLIILLFGTYVSLTANSQKGLLIMLCSVIAFPVLFLFRDFSEKYKSIVRLVCILLAVVSSALIFFLM